MNIAFQAVIFFALLLPGLLFIGTYNGRIIRETTPQNYTPFTKATIRVLLIAAILQTVWIILADSIGQPWGLSVDLYSGFYLLTGQYHDAKTFNNAIRSVVDHPESISIYFVTLYMVAYLLGLLLHKLVRAKQWDIKHKFWRFNSDWHYLLSGEARQFPETNDTPARVDFVKAAAVLEIGGVPYVYVGIIYDWYLDSKGNLDKLILHKVFRRKLSDDASEQEEDKENIEDDNRYYLVEGDYFLLDCANTKNINIEYYFIY